MSRPPSRSVTGVDGTDGNTALVASYRNGGFDMSKKLERRSGPETKTTLRLPRELWDRVRHRAIDEGLSAQAMIERMIEFYLDAPKPRTARAR
jgi:hypothetical protein